MILVENRDFFIPLAFDALVRGISVGILPSRLVWKKLGWRGYPTVKKNFEDVCNRLHTISACDRQTDRQTDGQTDILPRIVRAMHTRRAVKTEVIQLHVQNKWDFLLLGCEAINDVIDIQVWIARWMHIMVEPVRRFSSIEFLTYVFNHRNVQKDRSHDATVTGYVTKTFKSQHV